MCRLRVLAILAASLVFGANALFAHHGSRISYDLDVPGVSLTGMVTEFAFRNPHSTIFVDVTDADGLVTNWAFEHRNIGGLARQGYHRNTLQPGQEVTVEFHPSRSGAPVGLTIKVILADGKEILQWNHLGGDQ